MSRIALRRLLKAPIFTLFSILTLALGIGITTASYSALLSLGDKLAGVSEPSEVVVLRRTGARGAGFSGQEFLGLQDAQVRFGTLAAVDRFRSGLVFDVRPEFVTTEAVTGDYFRLLGIQPVLGRFIQEADNRPEAPSVLVMSHAVWRQQFNSDAGVIGRSLKLGGRLFEVIGVAPRDFNGVSGYRFGERTCNAWITLSAATQGRLGVVSGRDRILTIIGRLGSDVSRERAAVHFGSVISSASSTRESAVNDPLVVDSAFSSPTFGAQPGDSKVAALAIPLLILLVAASNLANLTLCRNAARRHEFAIRRALGGSRWRVISEQLVEGAFISVVGAVLGCVVAAQLLRAGVSTAQELLGVQSAGMFAPTMSQPVLIAAGALALLSFLVASVAPALSLTRASDRERLAADSGVGSGPKWRGRANLITLQVWVSVSLFLLTALGVRIMLNENRQLSLAAQEGVAQLDIIFEEQGRDEVAARSVTNGILSELATQPLLDTVAATSRPLGYPLSLRAGNGSAGLDLRRSPGGTLMLVTRGALPLLGVSMLSGRSFDDDDRQVAIINQSLARVLYGQSSAVGGTLLASSIDPLSWNKVTVSYDIVGVSSDMTNRAGRVENHVYVPFSQGYVGRASFLARSSRQRSTEAAGVIEAAVRRVDPELAISYSGRAAPERWLEVASFRLVARGGVLLGFCALALAMIGLYGVLSHVVERRTREIGLRMALGANQSQVFLLVLRNGLRPVIEGLVLGIASAVVLGWTVRPFLQAGLPGVSLWSLLAVIVSLVLSGITACYLPARRASRIAPNVALRDL